jgi:signal transduction histidine kinase
VNRRRVLAVLAAALGLLVAINALVYSLYRSEVRTVTGTLDDRLVALGVTSASWLASAGDADALLGVLVRENRLEDAYTVDSTLRVTAGVRTRAGQPLNLLRVDEPRLATAFEGQASVGGGYSIANTTVEAAYFPVRRHGAPLVLAIEAGAEYHAPADRLRHTYLVAVGLTGLAAGVFAVSLLLALRALERARLAHGRAERLAAVGQMAATVAHEVRNPLGILRGQIELARERLAPAAPPREQERFAEMLAEIERLNRLTEEFLGLTRDVALEAREVELGALVAAVADEVRLVAPQAEIIAELVTPGARTVRADPEKLRQAILNLVLNATQIGGAGVRVAPRTRWRTARRSSSGWRAGRAPRARSPAPTPRAAPGRRGPAALVRRDAGPPARQGHHRQVPPAVQREALRDRPRPARRRRDGPVLSARRRR